MRNIMPPYLLIGIRTNEFLAWLRGLHLDNEDKKQLLMLWADRVGTKITYDMIIRAGIEHYSS